MDRSHRERSNSMEGIAGGPLGLAYQIALSLRPLLNSDLPSNIHTALSNALLSIDALQATDPSPQPSDLASLFDVDAIVTFSDAWPRWRRAASTLLGTLEHAPLDQSLFQGRHTGAKHYFQGVNSLAQANAPSIAGWLRACGLHKKTFLDLGAGTGEYAAAFMDAGVSSQVVCADYPFVVNSIARRTGSGINWCAADFRRGGEYAPPCSIDTVWVSNVLHHYSVSDGIKILRSCASFLRDDSLLFVHEYCTDGAGTQGLAAGILGLHFGLTTDGGRCYRRSEIGTIVAEALGPHHVVDELTLPVSTCLMFQRG